MTDATASIIAGHIDVSQHQQVHSCQNQTMQEMQQQQTNRRAKKTIQVAVNHEIRVITWTICWPIKIEFNPSTSLPTQPQLSLNEETEKQSDQIR